VYEQAIEDKAAGRTVPVEKATERIEIRNASAQSKGNINR
jgi:hypothetical protein